MGQTALWDPRGRVAGTSNYLSQGIRVGAGSPHPRHSGLPAGRSGSGRRSGSESRPRARGLVTIMRQTVTRRPARAGRPAAIRGLSGSEPSPRGIVRRAAKWPVMSTVPLRKPRAARARREICETGDPPGLVAGLGTATVAGDDPAEKAESIGEALVIEAQASLLQEAVRKARLRGEASNAAAEATLRSRRRIGKMLQVLPKNPGGWRQRKSCGYALQPQDLPPTLEEHGLQTLPTVTKN